MNITVKWNNETPYSDLNIGDVFTLGGRVYMVTDQHEEGTAGELLSVNLANGEMEIFGSKVLTRRFDNATLTLE